MKAKVSVFILFLFATLLTACDSSDSSLQPADVMSTVSARVQEDNALRVDINIHFKQAVDCRIEYWKKGDDERICRTELESVKGDHVITLLFLEAETEYCFRVLADNGQEAVASAIYTFHTHALPAEIPPFELEQDELKESVPGYLLVARSDKKPGFIAFINPKGKVVWYHIVPGQTVQTVSFDPVHHTLQCIIGTHPTQNYACEGIMVLDLYGHVLLRKDISSQYPHHDIKRMPDGHLVMVHFVPKKFDLTAQGGGKEDTVFGDGILVLDMQGNVVWQWDCFSALNPTDDPDIVHAVGNLLPDRRKDWLHVNSVSFDEKGDFYITSNWRSQLWKIERATGRVVYILGKGGTVSMNEKEFMSGAHDSTPLAPDRIMLFDNGLERSQSRVSIFEVDPLAQTVKSSKLIELPTRCKSPFQGGVSQIGENLWVVNCSLSNAILFVDMEGKIYREIRTGYRVYRADYIKEPLSFSCMQY